MADFENTVIINVDLTPDDAARKAEAVAKSIADIKKEQDELKKSNQQSSAAYTQNQIQLQKLQRELKAYVTISQQATGSNNQLRAQLSLLNAQYDALSKTERETTSQGSLLLAQIKGINDELARSEAASGRFQRNVGNYPGQLGSAVNQFASYAPISGFGSGIISSATQASITNFTQSVGFLTQAMKDQATANQLVQLSTQKNTAASEAQATADEAAAEAATLRARADAAEAEAASARAEVTELETQITNQLIVAEEREAALEAAIAAERVALVAESEALATANQALAATTAELAAAETAQAEAAAAAAVAQAAAGASAQAAASKQGALASAFKGGAAVIVTALIAIGATVVSFLSKFDSFSDGLEQFKDRVGASFTEVGRQLSNAYEQGGIGGTLKKIFTDFGSITKASEEAGKAAAKFTAAFQDLQDAADINEIKNAELKNEADFYRLKAKNRLLDNADKQAYLDKAKALDEEAKANNEKYNSDYIATAVSFANNSGKLRNKLTGDQKEALSAGDIALANSLLNQDKISKEAYAKLQAAYKIQIAAKSQNNSDLERIQNDQDRYQQQADKKAESAQAAAQKRADAISKINEDRAKSELATAASILTVREKEVADINLDINKRIALYEKYGQDTTQLEKEREARISQLVQKFHQEDLKTIKTNVRAAEDLRISEIADADLRRIAQQKAQDTRALQDTDLQIQAVAARIGLGEKGLGDLLQSYIDKRDEQRKIADEHQLQARQEQEDKLKAAQQAAQQGIYKDETDLTNHLAEEYQKRQQLNEQLVNSYGSVAGAVADLAGKQTTLGKAALIAQKAFAIAEIIISSERAKAAVILKYSLLEAQAAAIPIAGEFLIIGLEVAKAAELSAITTQEIASVAVTAAQTIASVAGKATGGLHYSSDGKGALLRGPGSGTSDSMNARLSNGEAVINAESTAKHRGLLSAINQDGGGVAFASGGVFAGGSVASIGTSTTAQVRQQALLQSLLSQPTIVDVKDIIAAVNTRNKITSVGDF